MSKYTKEILEDAVINNNTVMGVLRYLGLKPAGGTHHYIKNRIKHFDIDISHFVGKASNRGKPPKRRKNASEILILRTNGTRCKRLQLKRALMDIGRTYVCEMCGISEWNNKQIVLNIHHKDGNWLNDAAENLQYLCPNCHSQTDNFSCNVM